MEVVVLSSVKKIIITMLSISYLDGSTPWPGFIIILLYLIT